MVKYVLSTRDESLEIKIQAKTKHWMITVMTDLDWAGDKSTRMSISRYGIWLNGGLVLWKSKAQLQHALSSMEAEFYALSEAAKDLRFLQLILENMGDSVELPIQVYCDNKSAVFMANNMC